MTRTSSSLSFVLAMLAALVAVGPASAADGYRSADTVVAAGAPADGYRSVDAVIAGGVSTDGYRSVDAVLAGDGRTESTVVSDYRSADAISAANGTPQVSGDRAGGQGYVDALLRSPATPQPQPVGVAARGGDGFHWDDALIGALMTSILLLVMLAAARLVGRHRRASAESHA